MTCSTTYSRICQKAGVITIENCGPLPCLTIASKLHNRWNVDLTTEVVVPYSLRTAVWTNLLEIKVNGSNAIEN